MHNIKPEPEITCPLFAKKKGYIKELTDKINRTEDIAERARLAQVLASEVKSFLSCTQYDEKNLECKDCRTISQMRSETAKLVIKAAKAGIKLGILTSPKRPGRKSVRSL